MFIVLLNLILSSFLLIMMVVSAFILTAVAISLIVISLVRSSKAKKENRKTLKVGLWVGIVMLVLPWVCLAFVIFFVMITDKFSNRWTFDREVVAETVAEKDADALYEMMAPDVMEKNSLTMTDLEAFFEQCDIENSSSADMERYTSFKSLGTADDPTGNHYRPDGNEFSYIMYYVNDNGGRIYMEGILYDHNNSGNVGIHYIEFMSKEPETGGWKPVAEFGEKVPD